MWVTVAAGTKGDMLVLQRKQTDYVRVVRLLSYHSPFIHGEGSWISAVSSRHAGVPYIRLNH